jgi:short chain dehydrogenase
MVNVGHRTRVASTRCRVSCIRSLFSRRVHQSRAAARRRDRARGAANSWPMSAARQAVDLVPARSCRRSYLKGSTIPTRVGLYATDECWAGGWGECAMGGTRRWRVRGTRGRCSSTYGAADELPFGASSYPDTAEDDRDTARLSDAINADQPHEAARPRPADFRFRGRVVPNSSTRIHPFSLQTEPSRSRNLFVGDAAKPLMLRRIVKVARDKFGGLDVLVNNAGADHTPQPLEHVGEQTFDRIVAIDTKAIYYASRYTVPFQGK